MLIEVCKGQAGLALYVDGTRVAGVRDNGLMTTILSVTVPEARAEAAEKKRDELYEKLLNLDAFITKWANRAEAAEKECGRLREGLTKIACMANMNHDGNHLQKIAHTALKAKP